jgi:small subunit ribosomal protein S4
MSRYLESSCRLCRREGLKLFLKGSRCNSPKCPIEKRGAVPPGQHGVKRGARRGSEYGEQLREKQKAKRIYGVREKQVKNLFKEARKDRSATGKAFLKLLERRLDNVVFRLGFAPSRKVARQIVNHRQVLVNGRKVNIASFRVKKGDVISLSTKATQIPTVKVCLDQKDYKLPSWLERKAAVGKVIDLPSDEDLPQEIDAQLIVEFYSR